MGVLRLVLTAVGLAAFATSSACALLLDGVPDVGEHCTFAGEETACGACLADACRDEIDACCGGGCGDALAQLEACAPGGDRDACAALKDDDGDGEARDDLADCAADACDGACPSARSITTCEDSYEGCACRIAPDDANDALCQVATGACCADAGWPGSGSCECVEVSCSFSSDLSSCSCQGYGYGRDEESCDDKGFLYCCASSSGCECRDDYSCDELGDTPVARCGVDDFPCGEGRFEVDQCHATEDDR